MNTKLVKSISQVILSLSEAERTMLDRELSLNQSEDSAMQKQYHLEELLDGMTTENLHPEISTDTLNGTLGSDINPFTKLSEVSFAMVWDNSEDAVYDNL